MNIAGWILQILLAIAFGMAGLTKMTQPTEKLRENMGWVDDFSASMVKGIGFLEVLGAIGLILPMLTGIVPQLTPVAALGLVLVMAGAAFTHFRRNEYPMIGVNLVLLILAAAIAYIRFVVEPA